MAPLVEKIDSIFSHERVEEIVDALRTDGSEWAQGMLKTLSEVSPTGLKITRKEILKGKNLSLDECLIMEHRLAYRSMEAKYSTDFYEGDFRFVFVIITVILIFFFLQESEHC